MKSGISFRGLRCYREKRTKTSKYNKLCGSVYHNYGMIYTVLLTYLNRSIFLTLPTNRLRAIITIYPFPKHKNSQ